MCVKRLLENCFTFIFYLFFKEVVSKLLNRKFLKCCKQVSRLLQDSFNSMSRLVYQMFLHEVSRVY